MRQILQPACASSGVWAVSDGRPIRVVIARRGSPTVFDSPDLAPPAHPAGYEKGAALGRGSGERSRHPVLGERGTHVGMAQLSWALASRSRAMPAGGRPSSPGGGSKPCPRFFAVRGTRFRAPVGARCRCEHRRSRAAAPSGLSASRSRLHFHSNRAAWVSSPAAKGSRRPWRSSPPRRRREPSPIRTRSRARGARTSQSRRSP